MLRNKFWMGLHQNLKDSSRHKFDSQASFDELRMELRSIGHEHLTKSDQKEGPRAQVKMAVAEAEENDPVKVLAAAMNKLTQQVSTMQQQIQGLKQGGGNKNQQAAGQTQKGQQGYQGKGGDARQTHPKEVWKPPVSGSMEQDPQTADEVSGRQNANPENRESQLANIVCYRCNGKGHLKKDCPSKTVPTCWSCGEAGHTKWACPQTQHLNLEQPPSGGGR